MSRVVDLRYCKRSFYVNEGLTIGVHRLRKDGSDEDGMASGIVRLDDATVETTDRFNQTRRSGRERLPQSFCESHVTLASVLP